MDATDFNQSYLNGLLDKIPKEKKKFLLGDLNLLNYNKHKTTNNFLDLLAFSSLPPDILQPTPLTGHSKILIDIILCNLTSHEVISGNIIGNISDHLPQFLIDPNIFANPSSNKSNTFERNWLVFNQDNFIFDYF